MSVSFPVCFWLRWAMRCFVGVSLINRKVTQLLTIQEWVGSSHPWCICLPHLEEGREGALLLFITLRRSHNPWSLSPIWWITYWACNRPPFSALSLSPPPWSLMCSAPWGSFSCRTPALSRWEEVRSDVSPIGLSTTHAHEFQLVLSLYLVMPSSFPAGFKLQLQMVKTTDLERLFNSSHNWVGSNPCNTSLLVVLHVKLDLTETRCP